MATKEDLVGRRFGSLVVLGLSGEQNIWGAKYWTCLCDCGNTTKFLAGSLNTVGNHTCGDAIHKIKNLVGMQFGKLKVIKLSNERTSHGQAIFECVCECGNHKNILSNKLMTGNTTSCGCNQYHGTIKDLTGKKFGRLTAICVLDERRRGKAVWKCSCDCGNTASVTSDGLLSGKTKSCGCLVGIDPNRTHKVCSSCRTDKSISEFHKNLTKPDKHTDLCKSCTVSKSSRDKPISNARVRERRRTDSGFRITHSLRSRLQHAIKGNTKSAKTLELLGCEVDYLKYHLESQFDENMTWDNYGSYWHIDHIRPCASFDLTQENEQMECFHYTNLQPLEKIENMKKGDKYDRSY
jgi:hypothetical protein